MARPNEFLVKFRPGVMPGEAANLNARVGTQEIRRLLKGRIALVRAVSATPDTVLSSYRGHAAVEYAEPNYYRYLLSTPPRRPLAVPNDPFYSFQWHYSNIGTEAAWDVTTGSALVVVAVIDTGILFGHADLNGVTVAGFDFVDDDTNPADPGCPGPSDVSHGSHVSGTIAAATNNATGVAGVNWGGPSRTRIMPLRVFGNIGGSCTATSADVIDAIEYAADHSARVINMSFGGPGFSQAEQDAVNYAYGLGVTLVAAAGNDNVDLGASPVYPACYANVIAVAATTITNTKAPYSNFGSCIDLSAPGGDVNTDLNGDGEPDGILSTSGTPATPTQYWWFDGTSMASPHVAGVAALLLSKGVTGAAMIQNVLQSTATDLGTSGYDTTFGWGKVNAAAAVGASVSTNPMLAFTGDLSGSTITVGSDQVGVASDGTFVITNAQSGTHTVFAWQDTNANGIIDAGDLYGTAPGVVIFPGTTTSGVMVSVSERPSGSPPINLAARRGAPLP
ncbi:MAG: S8 family serine peptidase [Armatimonadota bacterium]|nr:S8 family serine peptidase [Armatimonadota bacterium]MDR7448349.1 S8 family serine peptidase [Armatimonadota bacterium]MDR7479287.1 S8 family serine peptidase [Armatimonadota bacterium]MDR7490157.1 S8 family serine peptidase [Armatimonadota bacterium]MDR7501042.1 S8 family serine peptidase [Armatimonadota bacterium]